MTSLANLPREDEFSVWCFRDCLWFIITVLVMSDVSACCLCTHLKSHMNHWDIHISSWYTCHTLYPYSFAGGQRQPPEHWVPSPSSHNWSYEKTSLHIITMKLKTHVSLPALAPLWQTFDYVTIINFSSYYWKAWWYKYWKLHWFCVMCAWEIFYMSVSQGWGQEKVAGCSEHSNEPVCSIKFHKFLD